MWSAALVVSCSLLAHSITLPLEPVDSPSFEESEELQALEQSAGLDLFDKVLLTQIRYELLVDVGTPPQRFSLMVDTTFPYVAVVDSECEFCVASDTFSKGKSSTFHASEEIATVTNITGLLGSDIVRLHEVDAVVVAEQAMLVVQHDSKEMFNKGVGVLVPAR